MKIEPVVQGATRSLVISDVETANMYRWIDKVSIGQRQYRAGFRFPHTYFVLAALYRAAQTAGETTDAPASLERWLSARRTAYALRRTGLDRPIPSYGKFKPLKHQTRCYNFARRLESSMLSVAMSGGKTKLVIDLLSNLKAQRSLVVCPPKVLPVWQDQWEEHRFEGTPPILIPEGSAAERARQIREFQAENPFSIVVLNYQIIWRDGIDSALLGTPWSWIVADEVHNIKAPGGTASTFMARLGKSAVRRLGMSGTVMADSPRDIYAQYRFLDTGLFGSEYKKWDARYVERDPFQTHVVTGYKNEKELMAKYNRITYEVGDDELELPEENDTVYYAYFTPEEARIYRRFKKEGVVQLGDYELVADNVLARFARRQQMTGGTIEIKGEDPRRILFSRAKPALLAETVSEINEPFVICYRYDADKYEIHEALRAAGHKAGEVSGARNDYRGWQQGKFTCLVAQVQAAAEGIDLTRAGILGFYSYSLSLKDYLQIKRRIRRTSQTRKKVRFFHLLVHNTIDVDIYNALRGKKEVIDHLKALGESIR